MGDEAAQASWAICNYQQLHVLQATHISDFVLWRCPWLSWGFKIGGRRGREGNRWGARECKGDPSFANALVAPRYRASSWRGRQRHQMLLALVVCQLQNSRRRNTNNLFHNANRAPCCAACLFRVHYAWLLDPEASGPRSSLTQERSSISHTSTQRLPGKPVPIASRSWQKHLTISTLTESTR
jgi:hypothetical protein